MVFDKDIGNKPDTVWGKLANDMIDSCVPYKDGGNCIFLAVQEAFGFFYRGGFTENEFQRVRKGLDDLIDSQKETGSTEDGLTTTLAFMVPYLREKFIDIKNIYLGSGTIANMKETYEDFESLPIENATKKSCFEPPFFVFAKRESDSHVFFVKNKDDYIEKVKIHMREYPDVIGIMMVEKAKQQ